MPADLPAGRSAARAILGSITDRAAHLLDEFLKLSEAEREEFLAAVDVIHGGPTPTPDEQAAIDAAWREEIRSRAKRALAGEHGRPWEQVKTELMAELRNRRR